MMTLNEVAMIAREMQFWWTPYRYGTLARSVGDVGEIDLNGVGYIMFNVNNMAPYGAILNEVPVIHYRLVNKYTGKVYEGSYVNKHLHWVDDFCEDFANVQIPMLLPVRRVA